MTNEPTKTDMAKSLPGLGTPWPDRRRWETVRRLLAAWRFHYERGPVDTATINAYNSVARRGAKVGADILERGDDLRKLAAELLALEDFA